MKIEGLSAATKARLATKIRERIKKIEMLLDTIASKPEGADDAGDARTMNKKDEATLRLRLLDEEKELIVLEGDEGVSDIEEVRKENARLRRRHRQYEQLLARAGVDADRELGVMDLLEAVEPAPVVEVAAEAPPPVKVAPPEKVEAARAGRGKPRGKAAAVRSGDYAPRFDGVGK